MSFGCIRLCVSFSWCHTYPSASVSVSVCAWLWASFCAIIYQSHLGAFACASLFIGPHPSASVCVCVCMCMAAFRKIIHLSWYVCIFFGYLGAFTCASQFLRPHPSTSVLCLCVCIAVPFFWQVIPSDFISLHLLVCLLCIRFACFLSWGHIPVRVCVCMALFFFLQHNSFDVI